MSKIKVGQIYKITPSHNSMVIVYINYLTDRQESPFDMMTCIFNDGAVQCFRRIDIAGMRLLAEYPTWQEAVNSKEFNDVAED